MCMHGACQNLQTPQIRWCMVRAKTLQNCRESGNVRIQSQIAERAENHCEFQRHNGDLSVKGETGSVKGETISANFWQGKVQIYRQF